MKFRKIRRALARLLFRLAYRLDNGHVMPRAPRVYTGLPPIGGVDRDT